MAKEFDIYLRKHLAECDFLVYSITYHDGISVTNRLILEAALNGYLLHKFAALQMGSELEAHIDHMIKLCVEKLRIGVGIDASVDFESKSKLCMEASPLIIDASTVDLLSRISNRVESGLVLAVEPLVTQVASSAGRASLPLLAGAAVSDMLKQSLLNLRGDVTADAAIRQMSQVDYIGADSSTTVDSALQSLCYNLMFDASAAVEIVSLVLGTEIRHSLGVWYNGFALDSDVTGTWAQKFIAAESVAAVMQEATGTLVKVLYPDNADVVIEAPDLDADIKRYRLLEDMDDSAMDDISEMSLEELDYVWLT